MKTCVKSAVFSVMGLSVALLAGCSKTHLDAHIAPDNDTPVEIRLGAEISAPGSSIASSSRFGSVLSRAVVDKDYAGPLYVSFARLDQDETSGAYPADYSGVDSAFLASWQGALQPDRDEDGNDNDANATVIRFCDPKFYLSRSSNNSTKFVGWYPAYATQTALGAGGSVEIDIDGETDIMLSEELEANKNHIFGTFKGADDPDNRIFHFKHQLTQVRFFAYAVDASAPKVWGKIKSIKLKEQLPACKITLPATVDYVGTPASLPLVEKKAADDSVIDYTTDNGLTFSFDTSITVGDPNEQADREKSATECGYAMIAPVASKTAGGALTLIISTELGGSDREVEIVLPAAGFEIGKAYNIFLRFSAVTIEPKATITKWLEGGDVTIDM